MATTTEKLARRRFGFRLRTLMVLILVVALFVGWRANRAYVQRQAVARIIAANGSITYDFQFGVPSSSRGTKQPPAPGWLRRWIGDEYFQEVSGVTIRAYTSPEPVEAISHLDSLESLEISSLIRVGDGLEKIQGSSRLKIVKLSGPGVTDTWLGNLLQTSRNLERLELNGADISDAGLTHLSGLSKLEALGVVNSPKVTDATVEIVVPTLPSLTMLNLGAGLTDRSLPIIGRCQGLRKLTLSRTKVTDQGIANLEGLTRLSDLILDQTAMTDDGLAFLAGMVELRSLRLRETKITGKGFEHLGKLQKLFIVELDGSDFSDEGLPFLARLNSLQTVYLERTKVSDAGLIQLQGMPRLAKVYVGETRVTDAGLAAFLKQNPAVKQASNKLVSRQLMKSSN
jgi:hypothetical protein